MNSWIGRREPQRLLLRTRAKVNAWLHVLPRRHDEPLHEIESLFLPLVYGDDLIIQATPSDEPAFRLSSNRMDLLVNNSVEAAWQAFMNTLSHDARRLQWTIAAHLQKNIPERTGLGAGSGDAASMLLALNQLYERPLDEAQLLAVAGRLGSDVPFFIQHKCSIVQGTGQIVVPIPALPPLWCCLALPAFRTSTRAAYAALDEAMALQGTPATDPTVSLDSAIAALQTLSVLPAHESQRLNSFEAVLGGDRPVFLEIRRVLLASGALLSGLSGSGSAIFGIYAERAAAEAAALILQTRQNVQQTFVAKIG
ncbi:MAG: 4-(cytidine 5'-diphospho)-2-C-methyl-D-erythritol kinase [Candidatus Cryosericum sp.]